MSSKNGPDKSVFSSPLEEAWWAGAAYVSRNPYPNKPEFPNWDEAYQAWLSSKGLTPDQRELEEKRISELLDQDLLKRLRTERARADALQKRVEELTRGAKRRSNVR